MGILDQGVCSHTVVGPEAFWDTFSMNEIYNFVFENKRMPKPKPPKVIKKIQHVASVDVTVDAAPDDGFQLNKFLAALGTYVPDNEMYTKLCMYFANTGLDPAYVGKLCNEA